MRETFDNLDQGVMASAVAAVVATLRQTGVKPGDGIRWGDGPPNPLGGGR